MIYAVTFCTANWQKGVRHTGESRYPSLPSPWMPACAGMTNQGKIRVVGRLQFHTL